MESKKDIKGTMNEAKDVKAAAEKTAAKVTEVKNDEAALDKAASKAAEKVTEGKAAKGTAAKNTSTKKTAAKNETAKKTTAPKAVEKKAEEEDKEENKMTFFIQYSGKEISHEDIIQKIYEDSGKKSGSVKSLEIYVKPEEEAAYYVINKKVAGRVEL